MGRVRGKGQTTHKVAQVGGLVDTEPVHMSNHGNQSCRLSDSLCEL